MKKVSIIVPVYNVEKYISECITSLIEQTYENIEIIIINDGSTDKSKEICQELKEKDERIIFITKHNSGVSDTRNIGISKSTGDYIVFVDSDDYIDKHYIEEMVKGMKEEEFIDMAVCNYVELYKNVLLHGGSNLTDNLIITNKEAINDIYKLKSFGGYLWNKIFKNDIIRKYNIRFNKEIHMCEDMLFLLTYLSECNHIKRIPKELYFYRMRKSSMIWNKDEIKYKTLYNAYNQMYKIIYKNDVKMDYFYYMVLNSIFSNNLKLVNIQRYLQFNIFRAYDYVCRSKNIKNKEKIKLKIKKYINFIYSKYMNKKIEKYQLFD